MAAEIPEHLVAIRNAYPAARSDKDTWSKVHALAMTGEPDKIKQAHELARTATMTKPHLRVRHDAAMTARTKRKEFLVAQRAFEREMAKAFDDGASRMASVINRFAGADGKISPGRLHSAVDALKPANKEMYAAVNSTFIAAVRKATEMGLRSAMAQAVSAQGRAKALKAKESESDPVMEKTLAWLNEAANPLRATVSYPVTSTVFKKLFKGALKKTMEAGLFGKTGVSNRVWDLRDQNYLTLKRLTASGISRGASAATISRDIRGLLHQPSTLRGEAFDESKPGAGIYRSAYKNAMRLTRTESNRAYVGADAVFAEEKGWKMMYAVSTGQREFDECLRKGTLIRTGDGNVPIENVRVGDVVLTHKNRWMPVTRIFKNRIRDGSLVRLRFRVGRNHIHEIFCTPNHPFLVGGEWIPAERLRMGCRGIAEPLMRPEPSTQNENGGSGRVERGSERSSTLQHLGSTVAGSRGALLLPSMSSIYNDRTFFCPIPRSRIGADSGTGSCRQNNLGCRSPGVRQIVSSATQQISLAYQDVFYRNSDCSSRPSDNFHGSTPGSRISVISYRRRMSFRTQGKHGTGHDAEIDNIESSNRGAPACKTEARIAECKRRIESGDASSEPRLHKGANKTHDVVRRFYGEPEIALDSPQSSGGMLGKSLSSIYHTVPCGKNQVAELIEKETISTSYRFVYNLEVEGDNSYFANGIAVHNCDEYNGQVMTPEEFMDIYPLHPHCLCFSVLIFPEAE